MTTRVSKALEANVRREVEALLAAGSNARVISARVYGPDGLLRKLAQDREAREAFTRSGVASWLKERLAELRTDEIGEFERDIESLSGRMTLVVPKSLHAALKREAAAEGVSLAELLRLKASVPLKETSARLAGLG
ncbi:MAG: toxin-antitoxin system HicB family antitoxin [Candidatus Eisenbacteria bacterium]